MIRGMAVMLVALCCASCSEPREPASFAGISADSSSNSKWIDRSAMDTQIDPADDFYRFVNGSWLEETEIPSHLPWISPYVENYFIVRERLSAIVEAVAAKSYEGSSDSQRLGDFYTSYMDVATIERRGLQPLRPELAAVAGIQTREALVETFARFNRLHRRPGEGNSPFSVPFTVSARPDDRDAATMIATIRPGGLGMVDPRNYLGSAEGRSSVKARYLSHVERTLALAQIAEPASKATNIVALETRLAESSLRPTEKLDHDERYNKLTAGQLQTLTPNLDWTVYRNAAALTSAESFLVPEPAYLKALDELIEDVPLADWRAYLSWQLLRVYSPYLSRDFVDEDFSFHGRVEMGNEEPTARIDQAMPVVETAFAELLGKLYIAEYFSEEERQDVKAIAETVRQQFRISLMNSDWMGPETSKAALDKLAKMNIKVGYPERWRSYDGLAIRPDDLVGNLMRVNEFGYLRNISKVGRPVDTSEWQSPVYATSAYYWRVTNELAIPAGYLLPPWYDENAEPAMNYGGIGTVIGHEMAHGFDNQGSQYDGDGNLRRWWSAEDQRQFTERTEKLVAQYDLYSPRPDLFVDGRLTLSENIGDLTGVVMGYRAYQAVAKDSEAPVIDGFTDEQRFFISFATHWRAQYRDALLTRVLGNDGHPPQEYRANGPLVNFTPFYHAFGVSPGDGMYLPESERVELW